MSRSKKLITALLLMIFAVTVVTVTVYADEGGEFGDVATDPIATDSIYTEAPPTEVIIETTEAYYEPETTVYVEPETEYIEPVTDAPYTEPYNDNNNYNSDDGQSSYVGGGQTYVEPESTAPPAPLYDTNHKIDDTELSNKDWKEITANLAQANNAGADGDDFAFIQDNDGSGDNGDWMLVLGVVLILVSVACVTYVIADNVIKGKKLSSSPKLATAGNSHYRASDDYDDEYTSTRSEKKKINRSRKYDTADVKLPKSGTRYKDNGRRYK